MLRHAIVETGMRFVISHRCLGVGDGALVGRRPRFVGVFERRRRDRGRRARAVALTMLMT